MLAIESISVHHGNVQALYDVSLTVGQGETVAVLGANGAGKSTLLRSVMGLAKPSRGRITFEGEDLGRLQPHQIVSKGVSFVPEGRRIFPEMTVEENLSVAAPRSCPDVGQRRAEVYSLFPALDERRLTHAGRLSGGEQQMVAIGRALMARPRLLVVDEPSLGLSPGAMSKTVDALKGLSRSGMSVLLAEQSPEIALAASERAYIFENGRIQLSGKSAELADDPRVMGAYTGRGE